MKRLLLILTLALAATAAGGETSKTLEVKPATGPLAGRTLYSNSHALLIGISKYQHLPVDKRLQFADQDALALREQLIKSYGFATENVTLLLNEQATKAAIEKVLAAFADANRVGREDRLLIYFSGHGQTVTLPDAGEMGFLIPYDAQVDLRQPNNAGPYLDTCVEMDGLWKYLRGCPAKHALILADACFSGLLAQSRALGEREKLNPIEIAKQAARPARQALTAGGKGEEAVEDAVLGHGAFTFKLLEELRAEAAVAGEVFTATDLAAALKRSVSNLTEGKQTPVFGSYRTEGDFLFVTTAPSSVPPVVATVTTSVPASPAAAARELATLVNGMGKIARTTQQLVSSDTQGFTLRIIADPDADFPYQREYEIKYEDLDFSPRLSSLGIYLILYSKPGRNFTYRDLVTGAIKRTQAAMLNFRGDADTTRCIRLLRSAAGHPTLIEPLPDFPETERKAATLRLRDWVNAHARAVKSEFGTSDSEVTAVSADRFHLRNTHIDPEKGKAQTTVSEYEVRFADLDLEQLGFSDGSISSVSFSPLPGRRFLLDELRQGNPLFAHVSIVFPTPREAETFLTLLLQATGNRLAIPIQPKVR